MRLHVVVELVYCTLKYQKFIKNSHGFIGSVYYVHLSTFFFLHICHQNQRGNLPEFAGGPFCGIVGPRSRALESNHKRTTELHVSIPPFCDHLPQWRGWLEPTTMVAWGPTYFQEQAPSFKESHVFKATFLVNLCHQTERKQS